MDNTIINDKTADEIAYDRYLNKEYTYEEYLDVCVLEGIEPMPQLL